MVKTTLAASACALQFQYKFDVYMTGNTFSQNDWLWPSPTSQISNVAHIITMNLYDLILVILFLFLYKTQP